MGRHRSTLRELGWGLSNSPNPWKQGSAKRVVRTLDYSAAEVDEATAEPMTEQQATSSAADDKQQQDGRQNLDRIREQYEAQEAESKRKLDRLNGRIAELGEGKRAMWSVLGQYQAHKQKGADAGDRKAADEAETTLARREAELNDRAAALEKVKAEATAKTEAAQQQQQAAAERQTSLAEREKAVAAREAAVKEVDAKQATMKEQLAEREAACVARERILSEREADLSRRHEKQQANQASADADTATARQGVATESDQCKSGSAKEDSRERGCQAPDEAKGDGGHRHSMRFDR
jgi:chromosome segregation ATPase